MSLSTEKRKEAVENIRRIFGENLTKALRQCGKTQSDLVEHLGVSKGAVSQWCNGYRTPSPKPCYSAVFRIVTGFFFMTKCHITGLHKLA